MAEAKDADFIASMAYFWVDTSNVTIVLGADSAASGMCGCIGVVWARSGLAVGVAVY